MGAPVSLTYGLTLAEMCDLAYVIQVEAIERLALAQISLAPHMEGGGNIPTPDAAVAEFDQWLMARPKGLDRPAWETELRELIGVE
jgi:hypothetical protein